MKLKGKRGLQEERSKTEIEQALDLCAGFADRVCGEPQDAAEYPGPLEQSIATNWSHLPISELRTSIYCKDGSLLPA